MKIETELKVVDKHEPVWYNEKREYDYISSLTVEVIGDEVIMQIPKNYSYQVVFEKEEFLKLLKLIKLSEEF